MTVNVLQWSWCGSKINWMDAWIIFTSIYAKLQANVHDNNMLVIYTKQISSQQVAK